MYVAEVLLEQLLHHGVKFPVNRRRAVARGRADQLTASAACVLLVCFPLSSAPLIEPPCLMKDHLNNCLGK